MEPYAPIPAAGPFAASENLFTALVAELEGAEAAELLQDHLDLRAAREEQAAREHPVPVTGGDGITRSRLETGHGRLLASLFGTVQVTRCAWRCPGAPDLYPADAALSLPAPRYSHAVARLAAVEAVRGSFEAAHAAITRRCGASTYSEPDSLTQNELHPIAMAVADANCTQSTTWPESTSPSRPATDSGSSTPTSKRSPPRVQQCRAVTPGRSAGYRRC